MREQHRNAEIQIRRESIKRLMNGQIKKASRERRTYELMDNWKRMYYIASKRSKETNRVTD